MKGMMVSFIFLASSMAFAIGLQLSKIAFELERRHLLWISRVAYMAVLCIYYSYVFGRSPAEMFMDGATWALAAIFFYAGLAGMEIVWWVSSIVDDPPFMPYRFLKI